MRPVTKLVYGGDTPFTCPAPLHEQYSARTIYRRDTDGVYHLEKDGFRTLSQFDDSGKTAEDTLFFRHGVLHYSQ